MELQSRHIQYGPYDGRNDDSDIFGHFLCAFFCKLLEDISHWSTGIKKIHTLLNLMRIK